MADEISPLTTTESRVVIRHRGACTCTGWRGPWHDHIQLAEDDRDNHIRTAHSLLVYKENE